MSGPPSPARLDGLARGKSRPPPRHEHQHSPHHHTEPETRHQQYIDKLEVPSLAQIANIAQVQERKEEEVEKKYEQMQDANGAGQAPMDAAEREKAAGTIQVCDLVSESRMEAHGVIADVQRPPNEKANAGIESRSVDAMDRGLLLSILQDLCT